MLTCKEMTELCTDYLERRLSTVDRLRFRFHLALCKNCRTYLNQMQATVDAMDTMPPLTLPPDIEKEMLEHFRSWSKTPK